MTATSELRRLPPPDQQPITARLAGAGSVRRELEAVLAVAPLNASSGEMRDLILSDNAAAKGTASARLKTWGRLKARYVLDPRVAEFRAFRQALLATSSHADRGYLELLLFARNDRVFREITLAEISPLLSCDNAVVDSEGMTAALQGRLLGIDRTWSRETLVTSRQHLLSALKDFGVLRGSKIKRAVRPRPGSQVTLFAARLARLEGLTDRQTLDARWFKLLGLDRDRTVDLLYAAQRDGVLGFRQQAEVVELDLPAENAP